MFWPFYLHIAPPAKVTCPLLGLPDPTCLPHSLYFQEQKSVFITVVIINNSLIIIIIKRIVIAIIIIINKNLFTKGKSEEETGEMKKPQ